MEGSPEFGQTAARCTVLDGKSTGSKRGPSRAHLGRRSGLGTAGKVFLTAFGGRGRRRTVRRRSRFRPAARSGGKVSPVSYAQEGSEREMREWTTTKDGAQWRTHRRRERE